MNDERLRIGIIGGGCSGVLLTAHLARSAAAPMEIYLIERAPQFGRGTAYATTHSQHLLNAPAARMSAFDDDPTHFLRWLRRTSAACLNWTGGEFVPRGRYGNYLGEVLGAAMRAGHSRTKVELLSGTAAAIQHSRDRLEILLEDGEQVQVDRAVLCTGFARPGALPAGCRALNASHRHIADPWDDAQCRRIAPDDNVLVIGTGLTMIDFVVALAARRHRGWIHVVSRHGLLPQGHVPIESYPEFLAASGLPRSAAKQLALVRAEIARAAERGVAWQSVMETLRPRVQDLWRALPPIERKRFLRHLRPYWAIHRHRMAPEIAQRFAALRDAGRVSVGAGRIVDIAPTDPLRVSLRPRGHDVAVTFETDWVVNCTGPDAGDTFGDTLVAHLIKDGRARPDALGLGLDVTPCGTLIEADGKVSRSMFAVGAPTRGALWDVTAVPEIRRQCAALSETLVQQLAYA